MREIPTFLLAQAIALDPLTVSLHTPLNDVIALMAQAATARDGHLSKPLPTEREHLLTECEHLPTAASLSQSKQPQHAQPQPTQPQPTQPKPTQQPQSNCVVILEDGQPTGLLTEKDIVKLISVHGSLNELTVADVMSQPAFVLNAEEGPTIMSAIALMRRNQVHHLPVVNAQQQLTGLLTAEGLCQVLKPAEVMGVCQVHSVIRAPAIHALPTEPLTTIVQKLAEHDINCVVIVEARQYPTDPLTPLGLISARDIIHYQHQTHTSATHPSALTSAQTLANTQAQSVMSAPLFVVQQKASLESAHMLMTQHKVSQLVVINADGHLAGIVTEQDLQPVHPLNLYDETLEKYHETIASLHDKVAQLESEKDDLLTYRNQELEKLVVKNYTQLKRREQMLNSLALGVGIATGKDFWQSLVAALAKALRLDYALVGKLQEDPAKETETQKNKKLDDNKSDNNNEPDDNRSDGNNQQVKIVPLAMYGDGQALEHFKYDLAGGPYQEVIAHQARFYPEEVQRIFPEEPLFKDYHIEAYLGVALRNSAGQVIGLLLVLHCQALTDLDFIEEVLSIFADRASAELERQQAEKVQKQLEAQFLRTQRLESIGTLASGIAHDLNNILTPIMGIAQLLPRQAPHLSANIKRQLGVLEASAQRGADIVNQVLLFAKGGSGEREPVDIQPLVEEVTSFAQKAFSKSIDISVDVPSHLWWIEGDSTQIHQVLMNLCVNAHDAMPQGGKLSLSAANVTFDQALANHYIEAKVGPYIVIKVTDTGMGIEPEQLDRIFEPFFTTKQPDKGTGLGLSTVHSIVRQHGGFITAESSVGQGSEFEVYLPAVETAYPTGQDNEFSLPQGNGELILVVDDEAPIREVIQNILETHHYRVLMAVDGVDAIAQYTPSIPTISVVLMDVTMPNLDGTSSLQILQDINPNIKVIVTSGLPPSEQMMAQKGMAAFLKKPYTLATLLKTLRQVIDTLAP